MNQAIQMNDDQHWHAIKQWVEFSAQVSGAKVRCAVRKTTLERLVGLPLAEELNLLDAYHSVQFDIEELIEQKIADEDFTDDGGVVI